MRVTTKMLEAELYVDDFFMENKYYPSYSIVAIKFRLTKAAAFNRLKRYREKIKQSKTIVKTS